MEQIKHIKNISIENFKCFDYFSVEGFGRFNIILGNNNVGKTSFLEGLLFDENIIQTISNLQGVLQSRRITYDNEIDFDTINPLSFFINKLQKDNRIKVTISYENGKKFNATYQTQQLADIEEDVRKELTNNYSNFSQKDKEILKVVLNDDDVQYRNFDIHKNVENYDIMMPIMSPSIFYARDLVSYYSDYFTDSKEKKRSLTEQLKIIIPNIIDIELGINFIGDIPIIGIWLDNTDSLIPLPMFGDGTIRLFRMILEIVVSKNKYLCIDEIDTGIHYSKYKDFSRIVLKTAAANNVQLFISTHNNEFLKSFKEVLEEEEFLSFRNETKSFTLKKLPNGNVKAYRYDFEEFEFAIEQENELR